ncbi:unnamed protein product [Mytilus coruscus]|uniref:Uncharacterized protein n=1 Tax=Mytilus coruscus TaxID=42192 RepID=A0A6J8EXZ0_MYTCO|nr:unnamed protein product [Mytilus coruscus]
MHSSTSSGRSQVLLKTAIAPITYDKTQFTSANILFDEGAQRSFITQEMADLLNLRPHKKEAITISGFGESNKKVRNLQIATIYLKVTVRAKLLIQTLWKEGYNWDQVLPNNIVKSWCEILDDIRDVTVNTKIARHYFNDENENESNEKITLHVFVDASQRAYGASAYLCKGNTSSLVLKFVKECKSKRPYNLRKNARHEKHITKDEIDRTTCTWIIDIQNEKFSREKEQLPNPSQNKNLPLVRQLRLFIDTEGVIRCAGRIHNSQLDDSAKFPVLLPKKKSIYGLNYIERAPADVAFRSWTDNNANRPIILDTFH